MQFWPKDEDPRLDERSARFHARVMKGDLGTLPYVFDQANRDINVARASTHVTWDREKEKWCEVDHLMLTFYINCLLYTSPSPRDRYISRMPSSA